jgi:hypothetical protein
VLGASVAAIVGAVLLFSGDGGGDEETVATTITPGPTFSPASADEAAIADLARKSIDGLPRNEWPALYDDFTTGFQARCTREDFVQVGIEAADAQRAEGNLPLLGYARLEDLSVTADSATATIIGVVRGKFEYEIYAAFQRQEGIWRLSPPEGTAGCEGFTRPQD